MTYASLKETAEVLAANEKKANRDPITGEPGSHPVTTGVGAAIGAAAAVVGAIAMDAAIGSVLGPVGAIAGAAAGGIIGGGIGHGIGEAVHPTQLAWWKKNYASRPYAMKNADFIVYEPAYRFGIDMALKHKDKNFSDLEPGIQNNWNIARGSSILEWQEAKHAARDAFERLINADDEDMG